MGALCDIVGHSGKYASQVQEKHASQIRTLALQALYPLYLTGTPTVILGATLLNPDLNPAVNLV